ncbi:MAG: HAD-IA family hydrolase, partial [Woeseia sp.]
AGLPGEALEAWFAQTLRDGFALEVTGIYKPFKEIASGTLKSLFAARAFSVDPETMESILGGFSELAPHPDAATAFNKLHEADIRIVTLTNGSATVTQKLLQNAGLEKFVERTISIDEIRQWKPRRDVYLHAASCASVEPERLALVATHPWDIHGAARAGLITGFVARGKPFPTVMAQPDCIGDTLADVAAKLLNLS